MTKPVKTDPIMTKPIKTDPIETKPIKSKPKPRTELRTPSSTA
jgi:hypothetical protein